MSKMTCAKASATPVFLVNHCPTGRTHGSVRLRTYQVDPKTIGATGAPRIAPSEKQSNTLESAYRDLAQTFPSLPARFPAARCATGWLDTCAVPSRRADEFCVPAKTGARRQAVPAVPGICADRVCPAARATPAVCGAARSGPDPVTRYGAGTYRTLLRLPVARTATLPLDRPCRRCSLRCSALRVLFQEVIQCSDRPSWRRRLPSR